MSDDLLGLSTSANDLTIKIIQVVYRILLGVMARRFTSERKKKTMHMLHLEKNLPRWAPDCALKGFLGSPPRRSLPVAGMPNNKAAFFWLYKALNKTLER